MSQYVVACKSPRIGTNSGDTGARCGTMWCLIMSTSQLPLKKLFVAGLKTDGRYMEESTDFLGVDNRFKILS